MKKLLIAFAALTASTTLFTSCEDMMTVDSGDKTYVNAQDTLYSYLGIMRAMQDVAERQVILGEIRGDLVSPTEYATDTLRNISDFDNPQDKSCSMLNVADYYNVINNCNFYIYNCDTNRVKSNIKYMIPEYAQVKAIRAWAYLQLVKNYREVPYITEPVSNLDVINNFNYAANLVNKDNLVDRLIEDGLLQMVDTHYPQYGNTSNTWGTWQNGSVNISARLCFIPIRLVLGDLYLLRGNGENDYRQAARYYYEYLKQETTPLYLQGCFSQQLRSNFLNGTTVNGWGSWASVYTYSALTNEVITSIPSAANAGLGKMLTRVADIFGYTPSSSQSSTEATDDDGETTGEYEVSGSISVTRNYKRQYCPSEAYNDVNNAQTHILYRKNTSSGQAEIKDSIIEHDARIRFAVESDFSYEGVAYPLCSKASRGMQFYYTIPIYRKTLVWLRLAEAINRAGYPEFAFAILKDGLNQYTLPTVADRTAHTITSINGYDYWSKTHSETGLIVYIDPEDQTNLYYNDENGDFVDYVATAHNEGRVTTNKWNWNDYSYREIAYATYQPLYYISDTLRVQRFTQFLNFRDDVWNSTYGIHARGAGFYVRSSNGSSFSRWDTTNEGQILTNIYGTLDDEYYDYGRQLYLHGLNAATATMADTIDAVENIIVDELALETSFEGNRFTDLVRIAEHKNASGKQGTQWLAQKIANRGSRRATSTSPAVENYDGTLYSKLLNQQNWYFQLPAW